MENKPEQRTVSEDLFKTAMQQWHSTFDAIADGIAILDLEGTIQRCNVAMTKLVGKPFRDVIGGKCYTLVHGTSNHIAGCPFKRMLQSRQRETYEINKDNRWFFVTTDPMLDESGELIGAVHIMSDITERKLKEEEIQKRIEELERFRRATIQREFRIKELKEKVKAMGGSDAG
jgi:PAS domain S-box-containing protein